MQLASYVSTIVVIYATSDESKISNVYIIVYRNSSLHTYIYITRQGAVRDNT